MEQGIISTFRVYYLWTTFNGNAKATQVSDNVTMRNYWKSYNIIKGMTNISAAWRSEMSKSCMASGVSSGLVVFQIQKSMALSLHQ
jgi:hypothetical protein